MESNTLTKYINPIVSALPIDLVYLHGSVARGQQDALSDNDFGVLFNLKLNRQQRWNMLLSLPATFGSALHVSDENIDVVDLLSVPVLLQFNVISGQCIFCRSGERKMLFESYVLARYADEHHHFDRQFADTMEKLKKGVYFERRIPYL